MTAVRILPEVAADVAEAANWYDRESHAELGDRFEVTFYAFVEHLKHNGEIYRTVCADFRRVLLKPFPYALYYRFHGALLVVTLVIHAAREPRRVEALLRRRQSR